MVTLGELTAWLLVLLTIAWIWRGHGVRERALWYVRRHCEQEQVQLLDGNVALKGWRIVLDGKGQKRLARLYGFEFTVTSHERLSGTVAMFGRFLAKIEMQAYPIPDSSESGDAAVVEHYTPQQRSTRENNVIELQHWQKTKKRSD